MGIGCKRITRTFIGAALLLMLGATDAYALVVKEAAVVAGSVQVSGSQAARGADISWEGTVVARATKGGNFSFTTDTLPVGCVGTLSDGTTSIQVAISGCGSSASGNYGLTSTGQTISYAPGDDGAMRIGAALSYTDNGDGTVTDNNTRLTWEKKTDANVNDNYTWYGALDYVAALNAMNDGKGFAGYNDWRMPNQRELLSIVDYGRNNPPIDPVFGPTRGVSNYCNFWSSTSSANLPLQAAWSVDFAGDGGGILVLGKGSYLHVRAVRGGQ